MLSRLEMRRQALHILTGLVLVWLLYANIIGAPALAVITLGFVLCSYVLKRGYVIPLLQPLIDAVQRKTEKEGIPIQGGVCYFIGATVSVFLYPRQIAMASIAILALGDSVSRLVGPKGYLPHPFNPLKFIEGLLAGAAVATAGASLFVSGFHALAASLIVMFLEGWDIHFGKVKIDDNILIPVLAGAVLMVLSSCC